uniref:Uncharacterized protein n=1 Tax=Anguilla anguilla TaxID=7936 RepID=A0A0E9PZ66_ANGAN
MHAAHDQTKPASSTTAPPLRILFVYSTGEWSTEGTFLFFSKGERPERTVVNGESESERRGIKPLEQLVGLRPSSRAQLQSSFL